MHALTWIEPLDLASAIDEPYWALLYSGARADYSGRYSYLASGLIESVEGEDFAPLENTLSNDRSRFENAWFGYLGYGLKDSLETLTPDMPGSTLPNLWMGRFKTIYIFDHDEKILRLACGEPFSPGTSALTTYLPHIASIRSNMSRQEYLAKAAHIITRIHAGDLYQANLTRKFFGEFSEAPDSFALFKKLCAVSPAPYSAYIQLADKSILSSSPELFLDIDAQGNIRTRPIKGTAARSQDSAQDKLARETLAQSPKDRAENLMIVDLMRNDLSRSCVPGSIRVEGMFNVTTHATIHHMSGTVTGRKKPDCSTLDAIKYSFPPGSMTGAPKIQAMNLCSELEHQARGVYSGAIGWLGGDGGAELSVVIRTLILSGKNFEFQVGGGIVADSTPEKELKEIIDKARGILSALDIGSRRLEEL